MTARTGPNEVHCRHCGSIIKEQADICPDCGVSPDTPVDRSARSAYCRSCGESVSPEAELCPSCGVRIGGGTAASGSNSGGSSSSGLATVGMIFGILLLIASFGALTDGEIGSALLYGIVGALLVPRIRNWFRAHISVEHSITTFGRTRTVDERTARNASSPCSVCRGAVDDGIARLYREEFVLLGVPVHTYDSGVNHYCRSCLGEDVGAEHAADEARAEASAATETDRAR